MTCVCHLPQVSAEEVGQQPDTSDPSEDEAHIPDAVFLSSSEGEQALHPAKVCCALHVDAIKPAHARCTG